MVTIEEKIKLWREKILSSTNEEELSQVKKEIEETYSKAENNKLMDKMETLLFIASSKLEEIHTCDPFKLKKFPNLRKKARNNRLQK